MKGISHFFAGLGIFILSGQAAVKYAGPSVILSYVLSGIVAILAALSFSELAALMSHSGAAYTYTYASQFAMPSVFCSYKYHFFLALGGSHSIENIPRKFCSYL